MEIFVRLAIVKYVKTKIIKQMDVAVMKLFNEYVLPYLKKFDSQIFKFG